MATAVKSRNLRGLGWLTKKRVTYRRHVGKERQALKRQAIEERKERIALKKLEAEERAADAKIAAAQRKIETAGKKADAGGMSEAKFEAMKARMEREIEAQEQHKAAARARAGNPCAQTRKSHVSDRAKRYRANQRGCVPRGVKKCKVCGSKSDLMVDHIDGDESNGRKSNLRWLCRSCNTTLGAEMARTGQGRRTVQYNPAHKGAQTLGEYMQAVLQHTRGAHDDGGRIIHDTPKRKREEFASAIWAARKGRGNPERNSAMEFSTEYHLGYNLGQADRQSASLRKTPGELHATFAANFGTVPSASWESFEQAYQAGYGGQMGAAAPNPEMPAGNVKVHPSTRYRGKWDVFVGGIHRATKATQRGAESYAQRIRDANPTARINPEQEDTEYAQAKKIAELFHGRPVKEEITVTESIREHDWLWRIGPLVKLVIKPVTKKPRPRVPLPFHQTQEGMVHLMCSPDGKQFYLRGGDQELDLDALGMGPDTDWYRDQMLIGEAVEITYRDKKKFHHFKLTDYYHKLGEVTKKKPTLAYNSLAHKMEIFGGQARVETKDLVDGMSPGIVN